MRYSILRLAAVLTRTDPYAARLVLPAIWHGEAVMAVPHLRYINSATRALTGSLELKWLPPLAVAPARFGKVWL